MMKIIGNRQVARDTQVKAMAIAHETGAAALCQAARPVAAERMTPLDSGALFAGRSEVVIRHGAEVYRLRLTRQNKLILTK
jgi:hemin uptake protein HemP